MQLKNWSSMFVSILVVGMLMLASCSSDTKQATTQVAADDAKGMNAPAIDAPPGAIAAEVLTATATVQAVDPVKRTVTLKQASGEVSTIKCGKNVVNFDQIKVGDQVKVTITEEIAVYFRKSGEAPNAAIGSMIALAPKGAKPGVFMAEAGEITARVQEIDNAKHTITLLGPEGNSRTLHVDPKANLSAVKVGDDVTAQFAQSLGIMVEKP